MIDPTRRAAPVAGPEWLARLRERASLPHRTPREPLLTGSAVIGSIEPDVARRIFAAGLPLRRIGDGWTLAGPVDDALRALAGWLSDEKLGGRWRGELLDVVDDGGNRHGSIERAAVRALGIATHAVHLIGRRPDGAVWIQQRARDKAVDPGLWDTIMGGLVSSGETIT
ncbi:MAG: NUDIX hydrolase, partial [Caldimonas sp.]